MFVEGLFSDPRGRPSLKDLVALRLVVLDKVAALPEGIARLTERLRLQAELRLDDGADHKAARRGAAAQDAPHVDDAARRAIEEAQVLRREVDVVDLAELKTKLNMLMAH